MAYNIGSILYSEISHFTLSFIAGVITWISISYLLHILESDYSDRKHPSDIVTRFILAHREYFLLILCIAAALIAHILEDFYFNYF